MWLLYLGLCRCGYVGGRNVISKRITQRWLMHDLTEARRLFRARYRGKRYLAIIYLSAPMRHNGCHTTTSLPPSWSQKYGLHLPHPEMGPP
jgi:hypothetical protein